MPVGGNGVIEPAYCPIRFAQVGMRRGLFRVQGNGPADPLNGVLLPACLVRNQAERVHDIRVVRLDGEDLPVKRFRLRQAPRGVVLKSGLESLLDANRGQGMGEDDDVQTSLHAGSQTSRFPSIAGR
jgi:hypothetical protein